MSDDPGPVTCPNQPAVLAPGVAFTCTASHKTTQAELDAGTALTNTAGATLKFGSLTISSNLAVAKCTAIQRPTLALTKTGVLPVSIAAGQKVQYTYTLRNSGNVTLVRPIRVDDDKTSVTCPGSPATLAPGASLVCSADYALLPADISAQSVTNQATAHAGAIASTLQTLTLALPAGDVPQPAVGPKFAPE
jgi:hypothetical protein